MEIKFENVFYNDFISGFSVLKNINFTINEGVSCFVGHGGKSTILELIETLKFASSGTIKIGDQFICKRNKSLYRLRPHIGIVYQNPGDHFFMKTVREEIEFALNNFMYEDREKRTIDSLKMVGLNKSYLNKSPFQLSTSEQRLLNLAIVLAFNPKIILLDEPTFGVDNRFKRHLIKLIKMMKYRYKKIVVISSNDTDTLFEVCDKVYVVNDGKIVHDGDKYAIFGDYDLLKKYNINIPKTTYFSYLVKQKKGINIGVRNDINDVIKDVYRYVK